MSGMPVAGASEANLTTMPRIVVATSTDDTSGDDSTTQVTVSASGGILSCDDTPSTACLTATASGGVATFSKLVFTGRVGTSYTLTFTAPGLIQGRPGADQLQLIPFFRLHDSRYMLYWPRSTPVEKVHATCILPTLPLLIWLSLL